MKETKEYLENLLKPTDTCILALSGGPDSMCLLDLLQKSEKKIKIICAHVNHHTREANEKEYEFIKNYLDNQNITLEYYEIKDYQQGHFNENEARIKRYNFFKQLVKKYHADYLLTAHHGDDLVETILMRLIRGSSLTGYSGIKKESIWDEVKIIRPLISASKKDILEYVKANDIPYVVDETNNSDDYLRNRLRHHILPLLEKEEKNYYKKFLQYSETLQVANRCLDKIILEKLKAIELDGKVDRSKFLNEELDFQDLIFREYVKKCYGENLNKINDKHIKNCLQVIRSPGFNEKQLSLPDKKTLFINRNIFFIDSEIEKQHYCIKCSDKTILPSGDIVQKISKYETKSNYEIHLNSKEIALPLYLTTRKSGMKMAVKNLNGHQKVSDILINKKIPKMYRDKVPILIDNNGTVLWILGVSKSKYDLENKENYDIIYKYVKRKEK